MASAVHERLQQYEAASKAKQNNRALLIDPVWERQPEETPQAYGQFLLYRNTPVEQRSMRKLTVSPALAFRWSRRWSWIKRTEAWDAHLIELECSLDRSVVLRARARAIKFGAVAVDKAVSMVEQLATKKASASEAIALAQAGDKLARTALGLSESAAPAAAATSVAVTFAQGFAPAWLSPSVPQSQSVPLALPAPSDSAPCALSHAPKPALLAERIDNASVTVPKRTRSRTRTPRSTIEGTG